MQNRKDITRGRINGAAAARDTNSELLPLARPPPPRGRPESGLAHRRPPQHADPRCMYAPATYAPATWEGRQLHFWPIGFTMMDTEVASPWLCTCGAKRR